MPTKRYSQLADAMPQIVWTADASGAANYFNWRWFEYTGMTAEEAGPLGESAPRQEPDVVFQPGCVGHVCKLDALHAMPVEQVDHGAVR